MLASSSPASGTGTACCTTHALPADSQLQLNPVDRSRPGVAELAPVEIVSFVLPASGSAEDVILLLPGCLLLEEKDPLVVPIEVMDGQLAHHMLLPVDAPQAHFLRTRDPNTQARQKYVISLVWGVDKDTLTMTAIANNFVLTGAVLHASTAATGLRFEPGSWHGSTMSNNAAELKLVHLSYGLAFRNKATHYWLIPGNPIRTTTTYDFQYQRLAGTCSDAIFPHTLGQRLLERYLPSVLAAMVFEYVPQLLSVFSMVPGELHSWEERRWLHEETSELGIDAAPKLLYILDRGPQACDDHLLRCIIQEHDEYSTLATPHALYILFRRAEPSPESFSAMRPVVINCTEVVLEFRRFVLVTVPLTAGVEAGGALFPQAFAMQLEFDGAVHADAVTVTSHPESGTTESFDRLCFLSHMDGKPSAVHSVDIPWRLDEHAPASNNIISAVAAVPIEDGQLKLYSTAVMKDFMCIDPQRDRMRVLQGAGHVDIVQMEMTALLYSMHVCQPHFHRATGVQWSVQHTQQWPDLAVSDVQDHPNTVCNGKMWVSLPEPTSLLVARPVYSSRKHDVVYGGPDEACAFVGDTLPCVCQCVFALPGTVPLGVALPSLSFEKTESMLPLRCSRLASLTAELHRQSVAIEEAASKEVKSQEPTVDFGDSNWEWRSFDFQPKGLTSPPQPSAVSAFASTASFAFSVAGSNTTSAGTCTTPSAWGTAGGGATSSHVGGGTSSVFNTGTTAPFGSPISFASGTTINGTTTSATGKAAATFRVEDSAFGSTGGVSLAFGATDSSSSIFGKAGSTSAAFGTTSFARAGSTPSASSNTLDITSSAPGSTSTTHGGPITTDGASASSFAFGAAGSTTSTVGGSTSAIIFGAVGNTSCAEVGTTSSFLASTVSTSLPSSTASGITSPAPGSNSTTQPVFGASAAFGAATTSTPSSRSTTSSILGMAGSTASSASGTSGQSITSPAGSTSFSFGPTGSTPPCTGSSCSTSSSVVFGAGSSSAALGTTSPFGAPPTSFAFGTGGSTAPSTVGSSSTLPAFGATGSIAFGAPTTPIFATARATTSPQQGSTTSFGFGTTGASITGSAVASVFGNTSQFVDSSDSAPSHSDPRTSTVRKPSAPFNDVTGRLSQRVKPHVLLQPASTLPAYLGRASSDPPLAEPSIVKSLLATGLITRTRRRNAKANVFAGISVSFEVYGRSALLEATVHERYLTQGQRYCKMPPQITSKWPPGPIPILRHDPITLKLHPCECSQDKASAKASAPSGFVLAAQSVAELDRKMPVKNLPTGELYLACGDPDPLYGVYFDTGRLLVYPDAQVWRAFHLLVNSVDNNKYHRPYVASLLAEMSPFQLLLLDQLVKPNISDQVAKCFLAVVIGNAFDGAPVKDVLISLVKVATVLARGDIVRKERHSFKATVDPRRLTRLIDKALPVTFGFEESSTISPLFYRFVTYMRTHAPAVFKFLNTPEGARLADVDLPVCDDQQPARMNSLLLWLVHPDAHPMLASTSPAARKLPHSLRWLTARSWEVLFYGMCMPEYWLCVLVVDEPTQCAEAVDERMRALTAEAEENKDRSRFIAISVRELVAALRLCHLCGSVSIQQRVISSLYLGDLSYIARAYAMIKEYGHMWRVVEAGQSVGDPAHQPPQPQTQAPESKEDLATAENTDDKLMLPFDWGCFLNLLQLEERCHTAVVELGIVTASVGPELARPLLNFRVLTRTHAAFVSDEELVALLKADKLSVLNDAQAVLNHLGSLYTYMKQRSSDISSTSCFTSCFTLTRDFLMLLVYAMRLLHMLLLVNFRAQSEIGVFIRLLYKFVHMDIGKQGPTSPAIYLLQLALLRHYGLLLLHTPLVQEAHLALELSSVCTRSNNEKRNLLVEFFSATNRQELVRDLSSTGSSGHTETASDGTNAAPAWLFGQDAAGTAFDGWNTFEQSIEDARDTADHWSKHFLLSLVCKPCAASLHEDVLAPSDDTHQEYLRKLSLSHKRPLGAFAAWFNSLSLRTQLPKRS